MSVWEALAILGVGLLAGTVNTIVGSGSLITFPTLLAFGYAPVTANVSNTVGLAFGAASGSFGYRRELRGQRRRVLILGSGSFVGGLLGGILLLTLPSSVFDSVIPVLILLAVALVIAQPRLSAWVADRRSEHVEHGGPLLWACVFATGVYGGYFGAAQGVILLSLLGIFISDSLQRLNGVKNVLALIANGVAAVLFLFSAHIVWEVSALLAIGSIVGGQTGASIGRRLPAPWLRALIVVVGLVAAIKLMLD
jgi:uncharacterized membrane protein YfcA